MAEDEDGNLIDLFGGLKDLKDGMLRTPLDPMITMMDDPLRILRALRFSITKGFTIDLDIWSAMLQPEILEKLKLTVSSERIRDEVFKMMKHDTPKTLRLLTQVDIEFMPGFIDLIFTKGLWLKPTNEK
jgi:tRNA nucleotidyltransferase/poly(A) polymerase